MRVFLAGARGVIGVRLVPRLIAAGHEVAAMTRTPRKVERLQALGAEPVVCDVFDRDALCEAVKNFATSCSMSSPTCPTTGHRSPNGHGRLALARERISAWWS
jgi:nucleoside-diphosphate-sugar epimerase